MHCTQHWLYGWLVLVHASGPGEDEVGIPSCSDLWSEICWSEICRMDKIVRSRPGSGSDFAPAGDTKRALSWSEILERLDPAYFNKRPRTAGRGGAFSPAFPAIPAMFTPPIPSTQSTGNGNGHGHSNGIGYQPHQPHQLTSAPTVPTVPQPHRNRTAIAPTALTAPTNVRHVSRTN